MDEVQAPPITPDEATPARVPVSRLWRKDAQRFSAIPVCRTCALKNGLIQLLAAPSEFTCQIAKCENRSSYLAIE